MTLDQFRDMASEGLVVECLTVQERRNTLELFEEAGIKIGSVSRAHLLVTAEEDRDTEYMHPGIEPGKTRVSCFRSFGQAKMDIPHAVSYDDIRDIIENPSSLNEWSDAEFEADFASLLS